MRCKTKPPTKESLMCVMFWCVSPPGLLVSTLEWHCPDGSSEVDPLPPGGADGGSNFVRAIRAIEADVTLSDAKKDDPIIGKPAVCATDGRGSRCSTDQELVAEVHDEEAIVGVEQHSVPPKATTKHPRHRSGCTCIICIQSPSGTGPKHDQCCSCTICDIKQRRRRTQLLWRAKKKIEKAKHAPKELKSPNTDEEPHQSANNSDNTSKNHEHNSLLKSRLDLNFQPEEESLPGSNTTTKTKSLNHDDTVNCGFGPLSSSSPNSQIGKEDKARLKENTVAAGTTTSSW